MKNLCILVTGLLLAVFSVLPIYAQEPTIYTVQPGDTLSQVALKYNLNITELAAYNGITNPNLIVAGQTLTIPIQGQEPAAPELLPTTYTVQPGDTLFDIAAQLGVRMSRLAAVNNITDVNLIDVGQTLLVPSDEATANANIPLPEPFEKIEFSESSIIQGRTLVVSVTLAAPAQLTAIFEDRPVFLNGSDTHYWGITGIHALSEIGVYSIAFTAVLSDGTESAVAQNVIVTNGPYDTETIIVVPGRESLLEPEVIAAEAEKLQFIWSRVSAQKLWQGKFNYPLEEVRVTSDFGTRRSYGGGPINGFHGGVDFGGSGTPIYAPAAGNVVLAETLNVRGNAVLIDHGMGLFSGYWHQSQTAVQTGDHVEPGDLIGYVGDTGLVTGPHLHWEMRLGGIAVNPIQWVEETIPN